MNKLGLYTFPRTGRGWIAKNLCQQGMNVEFRMGPKFHKADVVVDHSGTPELYPDRIAITVARDPVYSIFSWHELNVDRRDDPNTPQALRNTIERSIDWLRTRHIPKLLQGKNVNVIRYEEMEEDIGGVIKRICDLADFPYKDIAHEQSWRKRKLEDFQYYTPELVDEIRSRLEPDYSELKRRFDWHD